jgi:phosphatidylinositol-specific phospholipase C-like protein
MDLVNVCQKNAPYEELSSRASAADAPVCDEILLCAQPVDVFQAPRPCNGHAAFCDRPYNKLVFPATHNSYSVLKEGFSEWVANQREGIARQLRDGIRVLLLDVHEGDGSVQLCHGPCWLGSRSHRDALTEIRNFLEENPREVLTLLYEDYVPATEIETDFLRSGLDAYVYTHPQGEGWPTLGEMIETGARLVVMSEHGGPPPAWFHPLWELAWDNPFGNHNEDDFSCRLNRGSRRNGLFLLNHWVNTSLDLPSEEEAIRVNRLETLYPRAMDCIQETGRLPNFIAVNFYDHGDLFRIVDLLNGVNKDLDAAFEAMAALHSMRQGLNYILFQGNLSPFFGHLEPYRSQGGETALARFPLGEK